MSKAFLSHKLPVCFNGLA